MFILVSYDVPDDKRRLKVAKALENYGNRVQYSVFECNLEPKQIEKLEAALKKLVKPEDSIRFYRLCAGCLATIHILGQGKVTKDEDFYIV